MAKPREALQHRRKQLGFTQEALAEALGVALNTYSEWERGVATPRVGFRPRIARQLDVTLIEVDRWLDDDGRISAPDGIEVLDWLGHSASLEQGASALWTFEPMVVPGLLQTTTYATAVERRGPDLVSDAAVTQKVRMRLARQDVLSRTPDPLALSVILDESILYRMAGSRKVMADQLERLIFEAERPTIDLRVLPFCAGEFSAAFGSFTVLTSPGATEPYMAYVLDRGGAHYLDRRLEVQIHARLFRYLTGVALSPSASIDLIHAVKERYL
jgi:transcriptional regulator with XRE-family HTH domain